MDKKSARRYGLDARAALRPEERSSKDERITARVISLIRDMKTIGCYVSMKDEADTYSILNWCLENGKTVAVPKVRGGTLEFHAIGSLDDLKQGCFGVMEPCRGRMIQPEETDIMLVPLSCFDNENNRTGYGKGYYDSVLGRCKRKTGIAYAEQKTDRIECDPWDVQLDHVIYE